MQKPDNWAELTWRERREKRFEWWRAAHGINFIDAGAKARHDARIERIIRAVKLEEPPDRVPVSGISGMFAAYYAGYDLKTVMFDVEKLREVWLKVARDFDTDTMGIPGIPNGRLFELMQPRTHKWPGGGLPDDDVLFQFVEEEYMKADEYELYFRSPADYILRYFLPRSFGIYEPLARLRPLDAFMGVGRQLMMTAGTPEFRQMAENLLKAHDSTVEWAKVAEECTKTCREMGYPGTGGGGSLAPFDIVADILRATRGSAMDMFRQQDALLEMIERTLPISLEETIRFVDMADSPISFLPMHKGDDSFMSDKQFETFYWPTFREMLLGMIEEGIVPMPLVEGSYNRRLEYIKDLPKTGVIWIFDKTDMAAAKRVLGGHTCIAGNVGASLMLTGGPEDVKKYCRWLIDTCAPGGGYIMSLGSGADNCDPANVHAMIDTAKEYGVYK
jgi:uroporphyrinogen-III decarboxylase